MTSGRNEEPRTGPKRSNRGNFEDRLITAGSSIIQAIPQSVFPDEQSLNNFCDIVRWVEMWQDDKGYMDDELKDILYKVVGAPAIDGRARDEGVQAHVGIFFPRHASKDDKQRLERMQFKNQDSREKENDEKKEQQ